ESASARASSARGGCSGQSDVSVDGAPRVISAWPKNDPRVGWHAVALRERGRLPRTTAVRLFPSLHARSAVHSATNLELVNMVSGGSNCVQPPRQSSHFERSGAGHLCRKMDQLSRKARGSVWLSSLHLTGSVSACVVGLGNSRRQGHSISCPYKD